MTKHQLNRRTVLKGMALAGIPMVSALHFGRPTDQQQAVDANAKPLWGHICGVPILSKDSHYTEINLQSIVEHFDPQTGISVVVHCDGITLPIAKIHHLTIRDGLLLAHEVCKADWLGRLCEFPYRFPSFRRTLDTNEFLLEQVAAITGGESYPWNAATVVMTRAVTGLTADHKPAICRHWTEMRTGLAPK